jgi:glycosyltransferase involved in cell wall biosynthesis
MESTEDMRVGRQTDKMTANTPRKAKFRVLFFSNSFVMGGMERQIIDLTRYFVANGLQADLIYSDANQKAIQPLLDGMQACGGSVHNVAERSGPVGWLRRFVSLYRLTRRLSPDVIHIHSSGPERGELPLLAFKAAKRAQCRLIRTDHNPPEGSPTRLDLLRIYLRDLLLDQVIVVSRQNRAVHLETLKRNPRKVLTVHNGIDAVATLTRAPEEVRSAWSFPSDTLVVGMVARLDEYRKGGDVFLRSVALARARCPEIRYVIIGDGTLRPALEQLAAQLKLSDYGRFVGQRADVADQLAGMDVFVLPSRYEGLPYSLLEALRAGKPCIAARVGGTDEVLHDDSAYGILFPPEDVDACSAAIVTLAQDEALRSHLAVIGPQRVAEQFTLDVMVAKLMRIYGAPTKLTTG